MIKKGILVGVLVLSVFTLNAQLINNIVRGEVRDVLTGMPIEGAHVNVAGEDMGVVTDSEGKYKIEYMPLGRQSLEFTFTGYAGVVRDLVVITGKEQVLDIQLEKLTLILDEVEVRNESFILTGEGIGSKSINMEQTNRIPANFFDPVRMATSFPGVVASNDQANNLVVRGNSPNSILWRLEGMTIVNPNHTANAGTLSDLPGLAGGGVNILSGQMLGESKFVASPFDSDLGNGLSAFDLKFRDGNDENWETTLQASLIGIDLAEEGPIGKGSLLANYRYSFVGLLTAAGIDFGGEAISFQDLSFNYSAPLKNGSFKVFGLGGISTNTFTPSDNQDDWEFDKDSKSIGYAGNTGAFGTVFDFNLNETSSLSISAMYSGTEQKRDFIENDFFVAVSKETGGEEYTLLKSVISSRVEYRKRLENANLTIGSLTDFHSGSLGIVAFTESLGAIKGVFDNELSGIHLQPFVSYNRYLSKQLFLESGLRYSYFSPTQSSSIEPRLRLTYDLTSNNSVYASYGRNSLLQTLQMYLTNPSNSELDNTLSDLITLGLRSSIGNKYALTAEAFYQSVTNAPITPFFGLNAVNLFDEDPIFFFENGGRSRNYGVEASLERSMINGFYFLAGGSVYRSEYNFNDQWWEGRFNGKYTGNLTLGREVGSEKKGTHRVFRYSARVLYLGGFNTTPIDEDISRMTGNTVYDYNNQYAESLEDYVRIDLSFSFRVNKPMSSRIVGLDIQNALGKENPYLPYFDVRQDDIVYQTQLGFIPVLYYKIEF